MLRAKLPLQTSCSFQGASGSYVIYRKAPAWALLESDVRKRTEGIGPAKSTDAGRASDSTGWRTAMTAGAESSGRVAYIAATQGTLSALGKDLHLMG